MKKSLKQEQREISISSQKGYPILLAGSLYFFVLAMLYFYIPLETLHLIWVVGLGLIFPSGILLGKLLKIDIIKKGNSLGTLGGIVAGSQAFYIPVFIMVYQNDPEWLPFTVGLLGASHFLPYYWIYDSKAYLFLAIATGIFVFISGGSFIESSYFVTPIGISVIYMLTVLLLLKENKKLSV